jgi:hypothetical protein
MSGNRITRGVKRVKSNESKAYDRVLSRQLNSKQIFLAIAISVLMVGSAFIVASSASATPPVPGVQLSGWTLKPSEGWTLGNIKGYNEGDVVPVRMTVTPNGWTHVSITVGFEWGYGVAPDPDVRGFDRVVTYPWAGDPDPLEHPFNMPVDPPLPPPPSNGPFSASGGATIVSQTHQALQSDGSPHWKIWDPWTLEIDLNPQLDSELKAGGLLFITTPDQKGASYFPGSSLHVRLLDVNGKKSAEDISINVEEVLSPPSVVLEKFCNPQMTLVGKKMTFLIAWENTGQSPALNLELWDFIALDEDGDPLLQYVSNSGIMWTSADPSEVPVPDPDLNPAPLAWVWDMGWTADGTGPYDANPVKVYYLQFEVLVIGWALGQQTNEAVLMWWDDHNPDPNFACAHCHFTILKPMIEIEKWEKKRFQCAAGTYIWYVDEEGVPVYWPGDEITYVIRVTNPSPDTPMNYEVIDPVIARELGLPTPGTPIMSGVLDPGDWDQEEFSYLVKGNEPEPEEHRYMFRNTATVIAWDIYEIGGKVVDWSYWDVDILHPDLEIIKTADCDMAMIGEVVHYTITVNNLGDADLTYFEIGDYMLNPYWWIYVSSPGEVLHAGDTLVLTDADIPELAHEVSWMDVSWDEELQDYVVSNTVWIYALDTQDHELYRWDNLKLRFIEPTIEITKTAVDDDGNEITQVGLSGIVRYEITVHNTATVPLTYFYWDDHSPAMVPEDPTAPPAIVWGDGGLPGYLQTYYDERLWAGTLNPDDSDTKYYTYTVQPDDPDPLVNTATVYAWHCLLHPEAWIWDDDGASVDILGWIYGYVYHDYNLDDVQMGVGDSALGGWIVTLYDSLLVPLDTTVTDSSGYYVFDYLVPGTYYVGETLFSTAWFATNPLGTMSSSLSVIAGEGTPWDFGNALYGYIDGYKFLDWDMDGEWDYPDPQYLQEPPLNGWVIHLDGTDYTGAEVHLTYTTGDDGIPGHYFFTVKPGTYDITEDFPEGQENSWYQTEPGPPLNHHHDVDLGEGGYVGPKMFGNVPLLTVEGYKFYDKDMDGVQQAGEPGLNGWTIWLVGTQNDGTPVSISTTTACHDDVDGWFQFTGVKPGTYALEEDFPLGQENDWFMTTDAGDLQIDFSRPLEPATDVQDIGNMRWAKVVGYKFMDTYGGTEEDLEWPNGVMDPDESGIPYWPIYYMPWGSCDWDVVLTSGYAPIGWYEITNLLPGKYVVYEDPLGWVETTPNPVVVTIPYFPWGDPIVIRLDFGNVEPLLDPKLAFELQPGWNMWSMPLKIVPGLTAKSLLSAIGPAGLIVSKLDAAAGLYSSYISGWDDSYDFPIVPGVGYFIYAMEHASFTLEGDQAGSSQVALSTGWNLVGWNKLTTGKASDLLGMITGCNGYIVSYLDSRTGIYYSYVAGWSAEYDFTVVYGQAYFIWVDGPGALVFP